MQPPGDGELLARTRVVKTATPEPQRLPPVPVFEGHEPTTPMPVFEGHEPTTPMPVFEGHEPTTPMPVLARQKPTMTQPVFDDQKPTTPRRVFEGHKPTTPRRVFEGHKPTTPRPVLEGRKLTAPHLIEGPKPATPRPVSEGPKPATPRPVFGQEPTRQVSVFEGHEPTLPRSVIEGQKPTTPRSVLDGMELARQVPVFATLEPTTLRPTVELPEPTAPRSAFESKELARQMPGFEALEPTTLRPGFEARPTTMRPAAEALEPTSMRRAFDVLEPTVLRPAVEVLEPTTMRPAVEVLEPTTMRPAVEVLEATVIWTRSETPASLRARDLTPPVARMPPPLPPGRAPVHAGGRTPPGLAPGLARGAVPAMPPGPTPGLAGGAMRAVPPGPAPGLAGGAMRVVPPGPAPGLAGGAMRAVPPGPAPGLARGPIPGGPPPVPGLARGSAPAPLGLTPLLEREVFQLARRIALQADLPAATRVLQHGLSRLTDSPDAMCVLFDPSLCSAWALPDGNAPRAIDDQAQQLVAQVAGTGQRAVLGHALVEPVGPVPARAVLVVRRPPAGAAYGAFEVATLAAIAAAVVGILGHFVADHGARREQELRDAKSPFRPEALAERRGAIAAPGRIVTTPRTWMRWAYPTLIGLVAAVVAAAAIVQVPTYSTGVAIITVEGEHVTSPMPGTVAEVLVAPNARVAAGDPIVRLHALDEEAELAATEADYRNALAVFLTNPRDDGARGALATIATRRQRAKTVVDGRTLRAKTAGVAGDIRVRVGQLVIPGAPVMKISERAEPSVVALLPGTDRPRLEVGMTLQIELPGFHKRREEAMIDSIGSQVIGPEEARRSLGDPIGDALPIMGPVVIVRAHLTARTFEAGGREYEFHDGMLGKAEVKVDHESLLRMLAPGAGD